MGHGKVSFFLRLEWSRHKPRLRQEGTTMFPELKAPGGLETAAPWFSDDRSFDAVRFESLNGRFSSRRSGVIDKGRVLRQTGQMRRTLGLFAIAACTVVPIARANAASEIVVAIRYLQAQGESHAHLFLYREDGTFLRQLTKDDSGQDLDPIFAPDGETIVFAREISENKLEFWSVEPKEGALKRLETAPEWYSA